MGFYDRALGVVGTMRNANCSRRRLAQRSGADLAGTREIKEPVYARVGLDFESDLNGSRRTSLVDNVC